MAPATHYLLVLLIALALIFHVASYKMKQAGDWQVATLRIVESLFITTIVMLFTTDRVNSDTDRASVELGWPLNYVLQDMSRFDPPYPYDMGWSWAVPTEYNVWAMGLNLLFYFICTYFFHWGICKTLKRAQ